MYAEYPEIYEKFPEKRQSKPRGANTLSENFKKLRAFFNWAQSEGIIKVSPFSKFKCEKDVNGNQKCSDFGNSECSIFGIKTTVLLASAVQ